MPDPGCFIVRATVPEAERQAFDDWYQDEHLPDAMKTFGARAAWRGWSQDDAAVHIAVYEFDDVAHAVAIPSSPGLKRLIAEFDSRWGTRVPRSREVVSLAQRITA